MESRINTNYVPSDKEVEYIRMDLVSLNQELARIDARIRELFTQRDQVQADIDSREALISLPRRLPADIVREIFLACLPADRNAVMSAQEAPLLLCRICSPWRTIALSTPRLWASLHIPLDYILRHEPRKPAVIEWLQRSAACPISLTLVFENQWNDPLPGGSALLKALINFAARWRHAEFVEFFSARTHELAEISPPALETLKFTGHVSLLSTLDIIKVPTLRVVAFHSRSAELLDDVVLPMPLVWDQLTHLTLQSSGEHRGFLFHNVVYILGRCKRLISFHVSVRKPNLTIASPLESIMMSFLETLVMDGSLAPTFLNHLIEYVSMPRLRQFSVVKLRGSGNLSLGGLGTGSPHIEYLSNISLSDLTAAETLRPFSALVKLVVSDDYNGNTTQFLNLLTPGLNPEVLCPMLQELVISFCCGLNKPTLDAFVRGRIELAQGFRRLEFENPMDWTLSQDELKSILSQGPEISIVHNDAGTETPSPWTGLSPDSS